MNKQNVSIERLDTPVTRRYSVLDVRDIARKYFEREFSWFDVRSSFIVEGTCQEVRVNYALTKTSRFDQRTFVDCRFHFQSRQMWIGSIQVAARNRLRGVGRQLVRAAEATAVALGMDEVRLLPVLSAVDFWIKLKYAPDPHVARVLWKHPASLAAATRHATDLG